MNLDIFSEKFISETLAIASDHKTLRADLVTIASFLIEKWQKMDNQPDDFLKAVRFALLANPSTPLKSKELLIFLYIKE